MNLEKIIRSSIKSVLVHWSESSLINEELGQDLDGSIDKEVSLNKFMALTVAAAEDIDSGYDKTKITINFHDGSSHEIRFDISKKEKCIIKYIESNLI